VFVCPCVCLLFTYAWAVRERWTDRDAVWSEETRVNLRNHVLDGDPDSARGRGSPAHSFISRVLSSPFAPTGWLRQCRQSVSLCRPPSESIVLGHSFTTFGASHIRTWRTPSPTCVDLQHRGPGQCEVIQRIPRRSRKIKTRLPDCRVRHKWLIDHSSLKPRLVYIEWYSIGSKRTSRHQTLWRVIEDVHMDWPLLNRNRACVLNYWMLFYSSK